MLIHSVLLAVQAAAVSPAVPFGVGERLEYGGKMGIIRAGQAVLEVKNGGPPIPEDVVPHMFKAFQRRRTKSSARTDGVGLGLFIAERIVAAHGGHISVRSSATDGTAFTVVLPGVAENPAGSPSDSASSPVAG